MSKKTRKEKIIADLRRKLKVTNIPSLAEKVTEIKSETSSFENLPPSTFHPLSSNQSASLYIYPVQLIKKDLTKTLLLCILAISLELALFLTLEKHLILPFRINI